MAVDSRLAPVLWFESRTATNFESYVMIYYYYQQMGGDATILANPIKPQKVLAGLDLVVVSRETLPPLVLHYEAVGIEVLRYQIQLAKPLLSIIPAHPKWLELMKKAEAQGTDLKALAWTYQPLYYSSIERYEDGDWNELNSSS